MATGTGKVTYKESFSGRGAHVAHITVQGTVDQVDGGQDRLWANARVTILPDGSLRCKYSPVVHRHPETRPPEAPPGYVWLDLGTRLRSCWAAHLELEPSG